MSKTNNLIFTILLVIAWIIFVGLCIEAGGLIVNFVFSLYRPEFVQNLYQKLDLSEVYKYSELTFFVIYGYIIAISVLKAWLFYTVVILMHKMDLSNPFNPFVSRQISRISYFTLFIGLLSLVASKVVESLMTDAVINGTLNQFWGESEAFILMGAVVYIISIIFKKGVEIQDEHDLTV